jgi:hypothetical protein
LEGKSYKGKQPSVLGAGDRDFSGESLFTGDVAFSVPMADNKNDKPIASSKIRFFAIANPKNFCNSPAAPEGSNSRQPIKASSPTAMS